MALFEKKTIIKNEIDYDKLAEKIVSAQEKSLKNNQENFETTIFKSVTTAIENSSKSKNKEGRATYTLIQFLAYGLLSIVFLLSAFFTIVLTIVLILFCAFKVSRLTISFILGKLDLNHLCQILIIQQNCLVS